jgi:hypothetical protein
MTRSGTILMAIMMTALASGCRSTLEPEGPPVIAGSIVARNVTIPAGSPSIHVKETLATPCGIVFRLSLTTRILHRAADGRITKASQSDLSVGRQVSVWAGAVMESCPGQATAEVVEIIE